MKRINRIQGQVKEILLNAEAGHDWHHIQRVCVNAKKILKHEVANEEIVMLGCLLHDIADPKFHQGDEEIGPRIAKQLLQKAGYTEEIQLEIETIIRGISFKNSFQVSSNPSIEFQIVQDADRLDALGAVGIARTFHYGGFKNRKLFDETIPPVIHQDKSTYTKSTSPTVNHFYEKLLLLKDKMNTSTAKQIASQRHEFMLTYLNHFFDEVGVDEKNPWKE